MIDFELDQNKGPIEIKLLAAGTNYLKVMSMVASELIGYFSPLKTGSFVSVNASHPPNQQTLSGPGWIAEKKFHVAIGSPTWMLKSASEGRGARGWGETSAPLRALAVLPHYDLMALAVRKDLGITSIRQISEGKVPLRISTCRLHNDHPLGWLLDSMFAEYGMEYEDITRWGGTLTYADRQPNFMEKVAEGTPDRFENLRSGRLNAVFDEAIMTRSWNQITDAVDMTFLPVDEEVMQALEKKHGAKRAVIEAGRFRGVDHDIPTFDFSGWIIYCHADLPNHIAGLVVHALSRQKEQIESLIRPDQGLSAPIDLSKTWQDTGLPLHPGAEQYYRENGYMK